MLLLQQSMSLWNTALLVGGAFMADVNINCGIFQGDSISPFLFCLEFKSEVLIQHLLCMDDLKLYAKNERDLNSLISTVYLFSNDIGMRINVEKSAKLIVSRDSVVSSADFELNSLGAIKDVHHE